MQLASYSCLTVNLLPSKVDPINEFTQGSKDNNAFLFTSVFNSFINLYLNLFNEYCVLLDDGALSAI